MDSLCVTLENVTISLGHSEVLNEVSMVCCTGQWTTLQGPSGAGKSTLLRAVNGLCSPTVGSICVLETTIPGRTGAQARDVWRRTGTVFQDLALFDSKCVLDNVALPLVTCGFSRLEARNRSYEWLERFGVEEKELAFPHMLSGGQRQRVALARACAIRPDLLVLDEPTSALDADTAARALSVIQELVRDGATVIMSTHRVDTMRDFADQRFLVDNGHAYAIA